MTTVEKAKKYAMPNFGERDFVVESGKGCYIFDEKGRKYLDFGAGIAVASLGHANARWLKALAGQAAKISHCSNLYLTKPNADLCQALVQRIGPGKVMMCNSGTEANEALIKAARLRGLSVSGKEGAKSRIITAINGFHGRTLGAVAATAQYKIQHGFEPLLQGFSYGEFNNLESFAKLMGDDVAAILVEPVQGESGVTPATKEFLKGLRALADKYNAMLLFDEVQCGFARSGKFLACQKYGVKPDGVSMAKGLGGSFPIGAVWLAKPYQDVFTPGTHGTTFGGNPLACAVALATIAEVDSKKLEANASIMGALLSRGLRALVKKYPDKLECERGLGLMRAAIFKPEYKNTEVCAKLRENGLILIPSGANGLRFLPPLNIKAADINKALKIFESTLEKL